MTYTNAWKREQIRRFRAGRDWDMVARYLIWLHGSWLAPVVGVIAGVAIGVPMGLVLMSILGLPDH